ncbi:MAG: TetR family transcriptional regulator [Spirochaetales bacterium]|nr:TetR family transcriptional regulator [Spirochaetales bacterium]
MKVRIPKRQKGINTKQRILESAIRMFAQKGFYKTNTKEIASGAGVPVGSFYAYFKNKKDVLYASVDYYNTLIASNIINFQDTINYENLDIRSMLKQIVNNAIKAHQVLPDFHNEITFLINTDPKIKTNMEKSIQYATKKTEETLNKMKDSIRVKNTRISSVLINRTVEDFIHFIIYGKPEYDRNLLIDEFIDMLSCYLSKSQ